jgi:hypothetical protein
MGVVEHERQAVNRDFPFPREGHEKGVINQPVPDAIKQDPSVNAAVVGMDQRSAQVLVSLRVRFHRQAFFPKIRECGIRTMVLSKTNESFSVFDERWKKMCVFCRGSQLLESEDIATICPRHFEGAEWWN